MLEKCTTNRNCKIISVEENGMTFIIQNNNMINIDQIKVDGCLISGNEEKCDWAFKIDEKNKVLFVELKGANIKKAISQIDSTLKKTKKYFEKTNKECFIVSSRVPALSHEVRTAKINFHKKYSALLNIKNIKYIYNI